MVGVLVGTYSSIFLATPLLVTLRERTELVRTHTRRVLNRRNKPAVAAAEGDSGAAGAKQTVTADAAAGAGAGATAAQPIRPRRPSGKRER